MERSFRKGDICYIIENNVRVTEGEIKSCSGNLYKIRLSSGAGTCLPKHRLYKSQEEAEEQIRAIRKFRNAL